VVIDEQHRFGVLQRRTLEGKGARPDLLVMTATPIPRSLALTQYGELDLSVIAELPPGRRPVATELVAAARRPELYRRLAAALDAGERAYVVFPRIEAGDGAGAPSLEREGEEVRAWLGPERTAALHGGLEPALREERLVAFAAGRVAALLATTVVEVGLDVPEAAWMVIEGAERYGLAQLHQLRGRVGRGPAPSRCVAVVGEGTEEGRRRLEVFLFLPDLRALADFEAWAEAFEVAFFCPLRELVVVAAEAAPASSNSAVSAPTAVHITRFLKPQPPGGKKPAAGPRIGSGGAGHDCMFAAGMPAEMLPN